MSSKKDPKRENNIGEAPIPNRRLRAALARFGSPPTDTSSAMTTSLLAKKNPLHSRKLGPLSLKKRPSLEIDISQRAPVTIVLQSEEEASTPPRNTLRLKKKKSSKLDHSMECDAVAERRYSESDVATQEVVKAALKAALMAGNIEPHPIPFSPKAPPAATPLEVKRQLLEMAEKELDHAVESFVQTLVAPQVYDVGTAIEAWRNVAAAHGATAQSAADAAAPKRDSPTASPTKSSDAAPTDSGKSTISDHSMADETQEAIATGGEGHQAAEEQEESPNVPSHKAVATIATGDEAAMDEATTDAAHDQVVLLSGEFVKQGQKFPWSWRRRGFEVTISDEKRPYLAYYDRDVKKGSIELGRVRLPNASDELGAQDKPHKPAAAFEIIFESASGKRHLRALATSEEERKQWLETTRQLLASACDGWV